MPSTGKVSREFFATQIAPRLGADRSDVAIGPQHGVDFGVVDVDGTALVTATDPVSLLPALGFERAGRFAVRILLADVAVSGLSPTHLTIGLTLPPELTDEEFATFWAAIHDECEHFGVEIVSGHTARYAGCSFPWVGAGTVLAVGDHGDIVRPDGATPGDDLLLTTGPAVEAASLFASLFASEIDCTEETLDRASARLDELDAASDALTAAEAGTVTAMHDVTEGGLLGALHEMATGADTRFSVDSDSVSLHSDVQRVCETLGMDPWTATSAGSLVIAADPESTDDVVAALRENGRHVDVIGAVSSGTGVVRDSEATEPPEGDSSWPVYERLLDDSAYPHS